MQDRFPAVKLFTVSLLFLLGAATACRTTRIKTFNPYEAGDSNPQEVVTTSAVTRLDPSLTEIPSDPYRLGPGDVIDIELLGSVEGPQRTFVGPDGKIYFHLLPGQQVWGMTLGETQRLLERELAAYEQNPQVSIILREVHSRRVSVLGRVFSPGIFPLSQPMTVLEAVSRAGGLFTSRMSGSTEEMADLHHSFLIRENQLVPIDFNALIRGGDTSFNIYLKPGDFIYLPSALGSNVFVLGAVYQPRAVPFKEQVTLLTAIAHCRGFTEDAKPKRVAIVRGSLHQPSIATVDAQAIISGRAPDLRLKPHDIVFVPSRPTMSISAYAELVVNTFARTLAANEGVRAAGGSEDVGVNIGIGN